MNHNIAREFLLLQRMAVVSTINGDKLPYSALVYYFLDVEGRLCFASLKTSQKMQNIIETSNVAMVVAHEVPPQTVQLEGKAEIITKPTEIVSILAGIAKVGNGNPESLSFPALTKFMIMEGTHLACARVTVDHYKFSDFSGDAFDIIEGTGKDLAQTH